MPSREEKARAELVGGVKSLAKSRGTTPEGLFAMYDGNGNGALNRDELRALLTDAHVGNGLTRGAWVSGIFQRLDKDSDDELTLSELDGVLASESKRSPNKPGERKPISETEAANLARRIADGEDVDLSGYTQAEIARIEAWNLDITKQPDAKRTTSPGRPGMGLMIALALGVLLVSSRG